MNGGKNISSKGNSTCKGPEVRDLSFENPVCSEKAANGEMRGQGGRWGDRPKGFFVQLDWIIRLTGNYRGCLSRSVYWKELSSCCVKRERDRSEEGTLMEWLLPEIMGA